MTFGWTGKILSIDLSNRVSSEIFLSKDIYLKYIGAKGLAGYFLSQKTSLNWNDELMPILLFPGSLAATSAPSSSRMTIMSRSPLTTAVGDTSVGGNLGVNIKRAGYDGIIIAGKSDSWVGIELVDDKIKFVNGSHLLDKPLSACFEYLKDKGSSAIIGQAAQNGVLFSSVMIDRHFAAARCGIGLCFAEKKIKYLSVKGSQSVSVYSQKQLKTATKDIVRLSASSSILLGEHGIRNFGTPAIYDLTYSRNMMPTGNFKTTVFKNAPQLNAQAIKQKYNPKKFGCSGCAIMCKKRTQANESLPEFETLSHFTALLENADLNIAIEAHQLCNQFGMDTISAAATLSCYCEIINKQLSGTQILELLTQIATGCGIGKELGQGSLRYAQSLKKSQFSMSVKGLELPAYDPRGAYGMALAYAVSTRGGCHLRGYTIGHELLRKPVATDRFSFSGKARIVKIAEDKNAIIDSLSTCKFMFFANTLEEYAKVFNAVTGQNTTSEDLLNIGQRIYYNERIMNWKWGLTSKDDDLPARFFTEPGTSGVNFDVSSINRKDFLKARSNYYIVRQLDKNGCPQKNIAKKLGIAWNN